MSPSNKSSNSIRNNNGSDLQYNYIMTQLITITRGL